MPHAFLLHLTSPLCGEGGAHPRPPRYPGLYAHGLFFSLLTKIDPGLAAAVHAAPRKPFTLAVLEPSRPSGRGEVVLRITILEDGLFAPLLRVLLRESLDGLALGDHLHGLVRVVATPQGSPLAGRHTWEELAAAPPSRGLRLRFHTPTVFATSKPGRRARYTPLPDPFLIAKSLLSSWQHHSPLRFPEVEAAALQSVFELDLELARFANLRFERAQAAKGFFPGFTGAVEVRCHSDSLEVQRALGILQAYAFYAGVGAKTAYGLGFTTPY